MNDFQKDMSLVDSQLNKKITFQLEKCDKLQLKLDAQKK